MSNVMNIEVLQRFLGKRVIIKRIAHDPYLQVIAIDGQLLARHEYLGKIPMWLLNQIPNGFSCLSVQQKPVVVELSPIEHSAIQSYHLKIDLEKRHNARKAQTSAVMLSAIAMAMSSR